MAEVSVPVYNKPDNVKIIVPNIDKPYYLWQQLVQINHFMEMGYDKDVIYPISVWGNPSPILQKMIDSPRIKAKIIPYQDTRELRNYPASLKPWLLWNYFRDNPDEVSNVFALLDADVIFTKLFNFDPFKDMVHKFYGSNTESYTGVGYIKGKGDQLFYELCQIAEINPELLEKNKGWEVGAQFIFQGADHDFWWEVYEKSSHMYKHMVDTQQKYKPDGHEYGIQSWCAELHDTQWVAMKYGFNPEVTPLMDFSWSNWKIQDWDKYPIWHNAGQASENGKDFCKVTWQSSPFHKQINVSPESISTKYVELIKRTEKNFPELIW